MQPSEVDPMDSANRVIEAFGMEPHPEGGWFVETWRATEPPAGGRAAGSAILYLLQTGERSRWHRLDADEVWQWSGGDALELRIHPTDGSESRSVRLGRTGDDGTVPQAVVPAGAWQSATPLGAWALVGCIVAPAFETTGFELAPDGWEPGDPTDPDTTRQTGNGSSRIPHGEP